MGCKIISVDRHSPAHHYKIKPGFELILVNGEKITDVLDYQFYTSDAKVDLLLRNEKKEEVRILIEKEEYEPLGLNFETFLIDQPKRCRNNCIFCFIDQLPAGMRDTLYFKDDDTRLSFLSGNYVTLTNLNREDIDRIIKQRISPINISVHTTDPDLRVKMLRNKNAGASLEYLYLLIQAEIEINCQIVLCKGVNDKEQLDQTMRDLSKFYPTIRSVSVVPAGLSKYRDGLFKLDSFTPQECADVIGQIQKQSDECQKKYGCRVIYPSDEFFLTAGIKIPDSHYYDDFPQIENGVGMIASFRDEFCDSLAQYSPKKARERKKTVSVATSTAAFDFISGLVDDLCKKCDNLFVHVYCIENSFFGKNITVSGLVTGVDLADQLKGKELGQCLYIPDTMLRSEGDMFLDSMTLQELENILHTKIVPVQANGSKFLETLTKGR